MKVTALEIILLILGPVVLRPVFSDNTEYMIACFVYGLGLGFGKLAFSDMDDK